MKLTLLLMILPVLMSTSCNSDGGDPVTGDTSLVRDTGDAGPADNTLNKDTIPGQPPATGPGGCNTAAGEIFSKIKKGCVVLSSLDRMEARDPSLDKSKPAYFAMDSIRVELFLPTQENSVVIRSTGKNTWTNGPLTFSLSNGKYRLVDEGKLLYEQ